MLQQAHFDFFEEIHKRNIERKKQQEELNKWLEWACNDPDVKEVKFKHKQLKQWNTIKGDIKCHGEQ